MQWQVPLADLDYGPQENEAVLQVLNSRWLTMGSVSQEFETRFADMVGSRHAIAVSNATDALHLACLALGIGPADEVIVPSLSFVATSNAGLYTGAQVRFADVVGEDDLTIDPLEVERLITPQTRAIIPMHYAGYPAHMEAILEIAGKHGLAVIEDAAHAPGARLNGRSAGAWSDIGCFSFFSNKNLSTGEGGMLTTNQDDLAEKLRILRSHGMTSLTWDRHQGHAYSYDVVALGYNDRIDEIRSALGLVQLGKLEANNRLRQERTRRYWKALENTPLGLPFCNLDQEPGFEPAYHIFPVLLPEGVERKAFMDHLKQAGVQTSIHYPPIHQFTYYRSRFPGVIVPKTESIARREVTLPLFPGMTDAQQDLVIASVIQALAI
jgi:dTDP-4-amino-4,6-dideoxygalactose transaminase